MRRRGLSCEKEDAGEGDYVGIGYSLLARATLDLKRDSRSELGSERVQPVQAKAAYAAYALSWLSHVSLTRTKRSQLDK